jgi:hypothetical protein
VIPDIAHFIWFGDELPWACYLSIESALAFGGFSRAILHHEAALRGTPIFSRLEGVPGLELREIEVEAILGPVEAETAPGLLNVYRQLSEPAGKANVLRAALLFAEGGVYLDLDTITVRDLGALRTAARAFCGVEHIVYPGAVRQSKNPFPKAVALLRRQVRDALRRSESGWRTFRRVQHLYVEAANNAVLGSEPDNAFVERLLRGMVTLPQSRRKVRYALGTHLLQSTLADVPESVCVMPPGAFYPLGPEISEHWFRLRSNLPRMSEVVLPETLVVHWYASVRTKRLLPVIDEAYVRRHENDQLFSRLACAVLDRRVAPLIGDEFPASANVP